MDRLRHRKAAKEHEKQVLEGNKSTRMSLKRERGERKRVLQMQQAFMLQKLKEQIASKSKSTLSREALDSSLTSRTLRSLSSVLEEIEKTEGFLQRVKNEHYVSMYEKQLSDCHLKMNELLRTIRSWKVKDTAADAPHRIACRILEVHEEHNGKDNFCVVLRETVHNILGGDHEITQTSD